MANLSLELIQYQNNDPFPIELKNIVTKIYNDIDDKVYLDNKVLLNKSPSIKQIEKLIRERFNLNIIFGKELYVFLPAAIIPFLSDYLTEVSSVRNINPSIFGNLFSGVDIFKHIKQLDKEKEEYFKRIHNRKGYISLKNARVGGYLADVKNYLIVDFFTLKECGIDPSELTAIIMHEIGHAFNGLEYHHRLTTTNATIADILNEINNNKVDKAYYLFKKHFDKNDIKEASLGSKAEITDFYGKIAKTYLGELSSQLQNSKYDETNFENLSDSFANRFNLGKDLVSGLHKLHTLNGVIVKNDPLIYGTLFFIEILTNVILLALLGPMAVLISATIIVVLFNSGNTTMRYDFPLDRYNRIKNGIVNSLKNKNLPEELTKELLDQFYFIDDIIKNSAEFKGIHDRIADIVLPNNRESNYYIHLQQTIENSLNSILFVKSAELKSI